MERRLIPDSDQAALRTVTSTDAVAEIERVRAATSTPLTWRLCPAFTCFYNPVGMTQAEIDAYDVAAIESQCVREFDGGRLFNAVVWALIDRINPPCTVTKFNTSRDKILAVYKTQPWKA